MLVTLREYREQQRVADVAHLGPGLYIGNGLTFGKNVSPNVRISPAATKKYYNPKKDITPAPGDYNTDRGHQFLSHRNGDTKIVKPQLLWKRPFEHSPDPGQYDKGFKTFGQDVRTI